jgi:D-alanyl-D-alanine carboxypeptidase
MRIFYFISLLTFSISISAQIKFKVPDLSIPHEKETNSGRFNSKLTETLDSVFTKIADGSNIRGFSAALTLPNGDVWKKASGTATDVPSTTALTTDHLIGMGSVTKSFTAAALLKLIDEGKAKLTDSIGKYLPTYKNIDPKITIRQMLNHTSGVSDYLNENDDFGNLINTIPDSIWSMDTILTYFVKPKNFNPGASWSYSNTNYLLAGKILETIEQKPWYVVVRDKISTPLGLSHTYAYPSESLSNEPFSHVFLDIDGNGISDDLNSINFPIEGLFSAGSSAGNLVTTPEDLNKFMVGVLGGSFYSPALYTEIYKNYAPANAGLRYGLGFMSLSLPNNLKNYGHNGYILHQAVSNYLPSKNIALTVMQNDASEYDPSIGSESYDLYIMYLELLETYIKNETSSSVDMVDSRFHFDIKSNIVSESLELTSENDLSSELFYISNLNGHIIISTFVNQEYIDLSNLPEGLYFVTCKNTTYPFVKVD